ncbi:MAG: MotA/TolQ/ExbB proton channel family protein [Pseudomonadota bacterium]
MEFSLVHMWETMGTIAKTVVYVLLFMSVGTIGIAIERLIAFVRASGQSTKFALDIRSALDGRDFARVGERQGLYKQSPLAQVVGSGVSEYNKALQARGAGATYEAVAAAQRASERSIDVELTRLRRGLGVLATVGSTAPFVGLFGTVFGIINAFQAMGEGQGDLATIGPGIAEALVTTAFGILVAIIGVWFYNAYTARVDAVGGALITAKNEIVDYFIKDEGRAQHTAA